MVREPVVDNVILLRATSLAGDVAMERGCEKVRLTKLLRCFG